MYKVSVIIPVYNADAYISECIESLLNQTLQECEFIFINDGSTDNSRQIIESYMNSSTRIKLINQANQGVSIARNRGLQIAAGEYTGFVDADDYIKPDMYETLYNAAKQGDCDVVISNFEGELDGHRVSYKYLFPDNVVLPRAYIEEEMLPYFIKTDNLNTACNKIYRQQIIKEHNLSFPEKVALGEDGMFNMLFFSYALNMKYIDYSGYYYREVAGSATRNLMEKDYFERALEVFKLELPEIHTGKLDRVKLYRLKSIKLIRSVMSYIHIYFIPSKEISFNQRYTYVKNMISNKYVRDALSVYYSESYSTSARYEKLVTDMIRSQSAVGLYCVTAYSRLRNRDGRGR
ncbi:glycosyltransferase [Paenibacillus radicis (ex Xue et al. 2023)]|uniref:Glycosyltransferase n=1 Tax=Paenibacillus radicis (ex Xue et al. 2023) TaxID=2972489 RepID=A0ABT1YQD1_9BACL|nr:glycosyltransferase [Paenibacillus radicis (ex Xue et al. 2023)]MCR8635389.1 glycosyltransferase [Paenibacillus radicis (ex Xue et al. 2023)]